MGLSEIVAALEMMTTEQRSRCVPTVDDADVSLRERFGVHVGALPCAPAVAERVVEAHGSGALVGASTRDTGVVPVTAAKLSHCCGGAGMIPPAPEVRCIVRDWVDGRISRANALALTDAEPSGFALTTYVKTHNPIDLLVGVAEGALADCTNAAVTKRDSLVETMSSVTDMQF